MPLAGLWCASSPVAAVGSMALALVPLPVVVALPRPERSVPTAQVMGQEEEEETLSAGVWAVLRLRLALPAPCWVQKCPGFEWAGGSQRSQCGGQAGPALEWPGCVAQVQREGGVCAPSLLCHGVSNILLQHWHLGYHSESREVLSGACCSHCSFASTDIGCLVPVT